MTRLDGHAGHLFEIAGDDLGVFSGQGPPE
jgi:hypothetical protein